MATLIFKDKPAAVYPLHADEVFMQMRTALPYTEWADSAGRRAQALSASPASTEKGISLGQPPGRTTLMVGERTIDRGL